MSAFEEIIVRGTRPVEAGNLATRFAPAAQVSGRSEFAQLLSQGPSEFQKLLRKGKAPIEEIVVKAKKPISITSKLLRVGGPVISVANVAAMMADQISRQRLDEAGRVATREVKRKPDTPVKTIEPETIDEIIVKGKRPVARPTFNFPKSRGMRDVGSFDQLLEMPLTIAQPRPIADPQIAAPDLENLNLKTSSAALPAGLAGSIAAIQQLTSNTFERLTQVLPKKEPTRTTLPFGSPAQVLTAPMPNPNPLADFRKDPPRRATRLTQPKPHRVSFRLPSTQTATASACGPCPKPTKTRKKRSTCWRKLVSERRDPRRDKIFKWVKLNCDTGKEIKSKKGK